MNPERIGLTVIDLGLFQWTVILKTGVQAVRRTYAFANFEHATDFVAMIGKQAEQSQVFPQVLTGTEVAEAVPTLVEVTIADPDLKIEHLILAKAIEGAYVAQMPSSQETTAGAAKTPAVHV